MSEQVFTVEINWKNSSNDLVFENYNRNHSIQFSGNQILNNSASKEFFGNEDHANPDELLISALATCHMLTFLAICSKKGIIVKSYRDNPKASLTKNANSKLCIDEIKLFPVIEFNSPEDMSKTELEKLHEKAHKNCFIAESIKAKVLIHS